MQLVVILTHGTQNSKPSPSLGSGSRVEMEEKASGQDQRSKYFWFC